MNTNFTEFKNALKNGIVNFSYTKANGETRQAQGTVEEGLLRGAHVMPAGNGSAENVQCYFDTEKKAWRSFKIDNFIGFEA